MGDMMHVHLHDTRTLRIERMGNNYDTLAALPGARYDKATKSLLVPLCHLRRISQMRPVVIDHECVEARRAQWVRWIRQHNHWGIWFALDADGKTVVPASEEGELSPVFLEHVAAHSAIIEQFLGDQVMPVAALAPVRSAEPTEGDRLIWNGIVNAGRAEERKAEVVERAKAKRRQAKQMILLEKDREH